MRRLIVADCLHCVLIKRECAGLLLYICIVRLFTILCEIYILVCNLHSCVKFTRIYVSHAFPTFCLVYGVFSQSRQATAFRLCPPASRTVVLVNVGIKISHVSPFRWFLAEVSNHGVYKLSAGN